jgi:8-oxo-dGTP diphosphatase
MPDRVAALIIRDGALLLVTGHDADFYWTPGGKVDGHDSPEATLIRELDEELALTVTRSRKFGDIKAENHVTGLTQTTIYYLVEIEGEPKPSQEITGFRWFTVGDFLSGTPKVSEVMKEVTYPALVNMGLM